MLSSLKSELLNNFGDLQRELRDFKNETTRTLKQHESSIIELKIAQSMNSGMLKNNPINRTDEKFSELKTELFVMETKFNQVENQFLLKLKTQEKMIDKLSL